MALRIISRSNELFQDRQAAGRLLAKELGEFCLGKTVVLGIPRGGVIVAREIARELGAEFDVVLAQKLGAPGRPGLAIGSVAEDGKTFLNQMLIRTLGISDSHVEEEKRRQLLEIRRRASLIRRVRPKVPLTNKIVIITDDGVATGATVQAAVWSVRLENPAKLIVAVPVGPRESLNKFSEDVDEVICFQVPEDFGTIGQFYLRFTPVDDDAFIGMLRRESEETLPAAE